MKMPKFNILIFNFLEEITKFYHVITKAQEMNRASDGKMTQSISVRMLCVIFMYDSAAAKH